MSEPRQLDDNTENRNVQAIHGGQGMQVNEPNAPVIQTGPNATINFNYSEAPPPETAPMSGGAGPGKRQRLQAEQVRLNQTWQMTHEKLSALETAYAIEAGAATKFQLENQIKTARAELETITTRLDAIEVSLADP